MPDGQALATALEVAETIAANGPVAVRAILRTMRETEGLAEADAFKIEARIGMEVFRSQDAKEGRAPLPRSASRTSATGECPWPLGTQDHRLRSWYQEGLASRIAPFTVISLPGRLKVRSQYGKARGSGPGRCPVAPGRGGRGRTRT